MAASIPTTIITSPVEIIAPNKSISSNSTQNTSSFKSELNSVSSRANSNDNEQKSSSKPSNIAKKDSGNVDLSENKSVSSSNANDTNQVKSQQKDLDVKEVASKHKNTSSNEVVSKNSPVDNKTADGKPLPDNGDELPHQTVSSNNSISDLKKEILQGESLNIEVKNTPVPNFSDATTELANPKLVDSKAVTADFQLQSNNLVDNTVLVENSIPGTSPASDKNSLSGNSIQNTVNNEIIAKSLQTQVTSPILPKEAVLNSIEPVVTAPENVVSKSEKVSDNSNVIQQPTIKNTLVSDASESIVKNIPITSIAGKVTDSINTLDSVVDKSAVSSQSSVIDKLENVSQISGREKEQLTDKEATLVKNNVVTIDQDSVKSQDRISVQQQNTSVNNAGIITKDTISALPPEAVLAQAKISESNGKQDLANIANPRESLNIEKISGALSNGIEGNTKNTSDLGNTSILADLNKASSIKEDVKVNATSLVPNAVVSNTSVVDSVQLTPVKDNAVNTNVLDKSLITNSKASTTEINEFNTAPQKATLNSVSPVNGQPAISATSLIENQSNLLNQSLEKMRLGIDTNIAKTETEEASQVKQASAKTISASEVTQQLSNLQSNFRTANPVQLQIPPGVTPENKNWGKAVSDKVMIAASQNLRVANIQLDPPELGALQVRLQVTGVDQQMSVSFTSPHASVRDALEQNLPRLREMLEDQGINLGESSVKDDGKGGEKNSGNNQNSNSGNYVDQGDGAPINQLNTQGTLSLVDFYA